jgi:signal transduction histidine kinase
VDVAVAIVILTFIANLFLGLFVLLRNPKSRSGQSFFAMSASVGAWAVTNYYTDNAGELRFNVLFNRLAYLFGFLAIVMAALFTHYFLRDKKQYPKQLKIFALLGIVAVSFLSVTNYVAGTVTKVNGSLKFSTGPLILFYLAEFFIILAFILRNMYELTKQGTPLQKNQAHIIIIGLSGATVVGTLSNIVIPNLSNNNFQAAKFGPPLLSLVLVTIFTYAIVSRKLFDIRLVVARSVGYSLLLFALCAAYFLGAFTIGGVLFQADTKSVAQQIYEVFIALILAFTFQPLRRLFENITDSIFYRGGYDAELLLSNLGAIMAREIELGRLTSDVIAEITSQMKLSKAVIVVLDENEIFYEANTTSNNHRTITLEELQKIGDGVVIKDSTENGDIKDILSKYDLDVSVDLKSTNELNGYLLLGSKKSGSIFNSTDIKTFTILAHELAIALHNAKSYTQIQNFNKTLQKRIDEATTQLRDANEHLKELDELKNEFLSMATHQLNTPLTVVDGYLTLINDGVVNEAAERRDYIEKTLERVRAMKRMVSDFLNVSRIETGKFIIDVQPTDLNKLVSEEVNGLGPSAKEKEVLLQFIPPKHPVPLVEMDEQKTRQAVMNLIDNAIYYTPKGEVKVYLDADENMATFKVVDNGIGVPEGQKDKLFQKFYRASNAKQERPNGNGVGLFLVKRVIEDQGGKIIFESTQGKGSTFGFTLPIKASTNTEHKSSEPPEEEIATA